MLKLYNTASKQKEVFKPLRPNEVTVYSCGMTVYSYPHIGHIKAYLMSDTLVRYLRDLGYRVKQVMNVTDVGHNLNDSDDADDKMEVRAKQENLTPWDVARKYEKMFFDNLNEMNISRPSIIARATENVNYMIDLIKKLEENGFVYKTDVGLQFDTSKFPNYAKFANLDLENQKAGARVEVDDGRKNPWDFALWILNKPNHIMKWDSPWGVGYPGWHIECSAMCLHYLGEQVDIHTGGVDHIKIHHTNEIAQSECATGKKFVNYWMHSGHLMVDNAKMSKSLGNGYTLEDLKSRGYHPLALRYMLLKGDYKKPFNFTWENIHNAQTELVKIWHAMSKIVNNVGGEILDKYLNRFRDALDDDLNTSLAITSLWDLINSKESSADKLATILKFDKVLGLDLENADYRLNELEDYQGISQLDKQNARLLLKDREQARKDKNYALADEIRNKIESMGFVIEDNKDGSFVKLPDYGKLQ